MGAFDTFLIDGTRWCLRGLAGRGRHDEIGTSSTTASTVPAGRTTSTRSHETASKGQRRAG